MVFGGFTSPPDATYNNTETFNGTNWTEVNNLNTARFHLASAGATNTAALAIGGYTVPPVTAVVESWNGTNWTEVADLNTARRLLAANGTQTSALAYGGWPPNMVVTESWNGTNWTEVNDLNTARRGFGGAGADNTSALAFGGYITTDQSVTEEWNGTNWTEVNDLNTARSDLGGLGTTPAALAVGGLPAATEEWTNPVLVTKTVDTD